MSYDSLGQRGDFNMSAGAHARQVPATAHRGTWRDYLRRHERDAIRAARDGITGVRQLAPELLMRVADARNLRAAAEHLRQRGETAPGPNGIRLIDLENSEIWEMCRVVAAAIRSGDYIPGSSRVKKIPKETGSRILDIQDVEDRVVGRGIVNIIQPMLDSLFDDRSNGYRPGRGRQQALAQAMVISQQLDRPVWMTTDLANAFDRVPLKRLGDVLRLYFTAELVTLMLQIAGKSQKRGLRQGNPLSALLLNIYLHHFLDRAWRKLYPDVPLLRTADDILIICPTMEDAIQARQNLERLLIPAGMLLSSNPDKNEITDLARGDIAHWLGLEISLTSDGYRVGIAERSWRKLSISLEHVHEMSAPSLRAHGLILDWVRQLGMCYEQVDRSQVYARVVSLARELAHEEVPDEESFLREWRQAQVRWQRLYDVIARAGGEIGGTACHLGGAASRCSDGASTGAPSLSFPAGERVTIHTDGACCPETRVGGWAAILSAPGAKTVRMASRLERTTNNRAELIAVIRGLHGLPSDTPVRIVSDSAYVLAGIAGDLDHWIAQGWRVGSGRGKRPLKNADLWYELHTLIVDRDVTCMWVRGHSGHRRNEECDALARLAANC